MSDQIKVLQKGKITIPIDVRERLGIKQGDSMTLKVVGSKLVLIPEGILPDPTKSLYGLAKGAAIKEPIDVELRKAAAARIAKKLSRAKK